MTHVEALNSADITKIGVGVIVAVIVIGILLSLLITAIIGRLVLAVVVIVLALFVWQQRSTIEDKIKAHKCPSGTTFLGIHLDPPDSLKSVCARSA